MYLLRNYLCLAVMLLSAIVCNAETKKKNAELLRTDADFFKTEEARRIGDQLLLYQRVTGGWQKNIDMALPLSDNEISKIKAEKSRRDDSTIDNKATTMQMAYLARLYKATGDVKYRDAFRRGVDFLLSGQYPGGGWPQFWPENRDYQIHITYNDNAMVNTMTTIFEIMNGTEPYDCKDLLPGKYRKKLKDSFSRGVECILATQIVTDGQLTVWCQQHDHDTYAPAKARAFELPSYCTNESAGILWLLMEIPDPDSRIKRAVHAAMRWLDDHKITGYRYERVNDEGQKDARLVPDPDAKPIWARFYDLKYGEPFVCDRDGVPRRRLEQIGYERRNGYGWYSNIAWLYKKYNDWADKWDPAGKLSLDLNSKGANETGKMLLDRTASIPFITLHY